MPKEFCYFLKSSNDTAISVVGNSINENKINLQEPINQIYRKNFLSQELIERFQNKVLRTIINGSWYVHNDAEQIKKNDETVAE